MKESLKPGIKFEHSFTLTEAKMVPALYPEASEFLEMPEVFATGFMVGLLEWACLKSVIPHLDWPHEQTVGTHVNISHEAATPAGFTVTAKIELVGIDGRRLKFNVEGHDGVDKISTGTHERFVILRQKFDSAIEQKRKSVV